MAGDFTAPNAHQVKLCRESAVDPIGMAVILENEDILVMKHHKSGNEVTITKGLAQRRKEQNGDQ
mgnify:CR=1 FL=1